MRHVEKTVFISYRRSDESWALAIYNWLTQHGFDVFIDYLGLGSGSFEKDILDNIAARAHFLVVLTLHALDRVDEPNDWMRREIEYAIDLKRNIIPVMLHEFQFDKDDVRSRLTGKLSVLKDYNGLAVPLGYFESAMERLAQRYLNVELETVLHPPSEMAQQSAERQRTAANGAVERVDELPPELVKQSKNWPNLAHPTAVAGDHHASNAVSEASSGAVILASSVLAAPMDVTNGLSAATVVRIPPPETAVTGEVGSEPLPSPLLANLAIFQEGRSLRFEYSGDGRPPELFVVQQQPGLVEQLVRQRIDSSVWDAAFGRMLFQLLVPKGLKDALCRLSRLILVVDSHTAALPWELMIPTDLSLGNDIRHNNELDLPIALRAVVVRQVLPSKSYQPESRTNITHTAMVVANPSVEGYRSVFAGMRGKRSFVLPSLPGAEIAAQAVVDRLLGANYMVVSTMGNDCSAVDVIERLMQPFRFLHIAGPILAS